MGVEENRHLYAACKDIPRDKPEQNVSEEVARDIGRKYRTLPMFEKGVHEYTFRAFASLQKNALLRCRWSQYQHRYEERKLSPIVFPSHKDLHFYNCSVQYRPDLSMFRFPDVRMKQTLGPGLDDRGQRLVPQERYYKRLGPPRPRPAPLHKRKAQAKDEAAKKS